MSLKTYRQKREFLRTQEPRGTTSPKRGANKPRFVVQKHAASRLHFDFRLEWDGVLKSWAVPKGPSLDPFQRQLAVQVEDHPVDYIDFEGTIPQGQYGGGTVMVWDRGEWQPVDDPDRGFRKGKLTFDLNGERLKGRWSLIQMHGKAGDGGKNWLFLKQDDRYAGGKRKKDAVERFQTSVKSGRKMDEIARASDAVWTGGQAETTSRDIPDPLQLPGAKKRRQPEFLAPQLATLVDRAPEGDDWLHEIKFDGYRLIAVVEDGTPKLLTRRGKNWTSKFPSVAQAVAELGVDRCLLDGELVVLAGDGTTDFQALQNVLKHRGSAELAYYLFDVPYCLGADLTQTPLLERKEFLRRLLQPLPPEGLIRFSDHIRGNGGRFIDKACGLGLEGVISKEVHSSYQSRRSRTWVKSKCTHRQEFVVVGWTDPEGTRVGFGALLLAVNNDDGDLVYCGRVGTGFSQRTLRDIAATLEPLARKSPPVGNPPTGPDARGVHWVSPRLVAEVQFTQWTRDGRLRNPAFHGLRTDKPPEEIRREEPSASPRPHKKSRTSSVRRSTRTDSRPIAPAGVKLSHPDKVLYPERDLTKRQLVEYYLRVAEHLLPHIVDRPLSAFRCPDGRHKACFFQKHRNRTTPKAIGGVSIQEGGKTAEYLVVNDLKGLITLVQLGTLELHPWGSRTDAVEKPDRIVFDLDPGQGVDWSEVVSAARLLRERLDGLGLQSFVRTTGGKGLHVVIPIIRRSSWSDVKQFARSLADEFEREAPDRFVATASKSRRAGRIYVDYLRNSRGATAIASYSTRARPGAPVATPIRWDELSARLDPAEFTTASLPRRLDALNADPWDGFFKTRQSLTRKMRQSVP